MILKFIGIISYSKTNLGMIILIPNFDLLVDDILEQDQKQKLIDLLINGYKIKLIQF